MDYLNVYVAVCDILGYKDLIKNNSVEEAKKFMNVFIKIIYDTTTFIDEEIKRSEDKGFDFFKQVRINFSLISDTIVLWTDENDEWSFKYLIKHISILFYISMYIGIPLRGAICKGDICANNESNNNAVYNISDNSQTPRIRNLSTLFGEGLVKAYELEQKQNWSGCIIDKDCYSDNTFIYPETGFIYKHVPIKVKLENSTQYETTFEKYLTINWCYMSFFDKDFTKETVLASFEKYNKSINEKLTKEKIRYTIKFFNDSKKFYEKHDPRRIEYHKAMINSNGNEKLISNIVDYISMINT